MKLPRFARIRHTFEAADFAPGQLVLGPNQLANTDHLAPRRSWYQVHLVDERARQVVTTAGFRIRFAYVEEIDRSAAFHQTEREAVQGSRQRDLT